MKPKMVAVEPTKNAMIKEVKKLCCSPLLLNKNSFQCVKVKVAGNKCGYAQFNPNERISKKISGSTHQAASIYTGMVPFLNTQ